MRVAQGVVADGVTPLPLILARYAFLIRLAKLSA